MDSKKKLITAALSLLLLSMLVVTTLFTPLARAQLSLGLNPTSGTVGESVTVTGAGFTPNGTVSIDFSGTNVATTSADDSGAISTTFTVPSESPGSYSVTTTDAGGAGSATASFTVVQNLFLTVDPTQGQAGTTVTVTGAGFTPSGTVNIDFSGTNVATTSADDSGAIIAT